MARFTCLSTWTVPSWMNFFFLQIIKFNTFKNRHKFPNYFLFSLAFLHSIILALSERCYNQQISFYIYAKCDGTWNILNENLSKISYTVYQPYHLIHYWNFHGIQEKYYNRNPPYPFYWNCYFCDNFCVEP